MNNTTYNAINSLRFHPSGIARTTDNLTSNLKSKKKKSIKMKKKKQKKT